VFTANLANTLGILVLVHKPLPPLPKDQPGFLEHPAHSGPVRMGDGCVFVASSPSGLGLFAARPFAEGETLLQFTGALLTLEQVIAMGEAQANPLQVDDQLYLDIGYPGVYANHSCRPNAGIRDDVWLVALEPISPGQEIFWDYSTSMWEDYWVMDCQCGEPGCRRQIGDFPSLPTWQQWEYLSRGFVQQFIRRRLDREGASGLR
jgi:hypothetical protein